MELDSGILASVSQSSNPVVNCIRRAKVIFRRNENFHEINFFDYLVNSHLRIGVWYLSLKYHSQFKEYICGRVNHVEPDFVKSQNPILLVLVDTESVDDVGFTDLTTMCVVNNIRLLCAWTVEECARILEILHLFGPDRAGEIARGQFSSVVSDRTLWGTMARDAIQSLQGGIGPKDSNKLLNHFKTIKSLVQATESQLIDIPSVGTKKSRHIFSAMNNPW